MSHKKWGGRFKKALNSQVEKFNASITFDYILYEYDIKGSISHAKMLAKQGLLSAEEMKLICDGLVELNHEFKQGIHALDEYYEDIHMYIEELLIQKIGETGKKLHTGRSRNDQVALDLRLYARDKYEDIKILLQNMMTILEHFKQKYEHQEMPGYTHLQQAQPITLGKYFDAYLQMFKRDNSRLEDWKNRMNFSPLGAGALAGSGLPLDRVYVADDLDFFGVCENTIDAVSDRDFIIEFCSVASIIMVHLSRLCEDLILWATLEFNFIKLDDAFATGSSLMPNKKNPDVLELVRGKSGRVFGHLVAILTVMKGLPLSYNKDMQEDKEGFFDTVNTLIACLEVMSPFLESVQFNSDVMRERAQSKYLHATEMLESLVLKGVPFRDAHHQVGLWIAKCEEDKKWPT